MTTDDGEFVCDSFTVHVLFGVFGTILVFSLSWNVFWCVSRFCSGKGMYQSKKLQRQSRRQMEENPIYGNLSYMQTSRTLFTNTDPPHSSDQQRVDCDSQSKTQDCYANLTLKAPRLQSGHSSPQIQYSDVIQLEKLSESQKADEGNTDTISTMSDLYASVQTQRTKTIDPSVGGEEYANHL